MSHKLERELLERISTVLRTEARATATRLGLQPVHLEIAAYLHRCNRYSNTPAALAEYLGATKGTISQSLLRLEEKGYLKKNVDVDDRRVVHLVLTAKGRRLVSADGKDPLRTALAEARSATGVSLADSLMTLLRSWQRANGLRTFGCCSTCRLFETVSDHRFRCGLTKEALSRADSQKICREHEPVAENS